MERGFPVADAHCDFLYGMYRYGYDIRTRKDAQTIYLPHMKKGNVRLQFFASWMDSALKTPYLQQCISMIDAYNRMLEENEELSPLTRDFDWNGGKIATVLTVEGGEAIEGSLGALRILKRLGVAAMTLTWNNNNELAFAAMKRQSKGLTALGREVVLEMERIGMAIDLSHLSDQGIEDVLALTTKPVFASHSNARQVYHTPRALPDEYIQEIAARGGVVGVNFFHKQLGANRCASMQDIVAHILHIVRVGGDDCCAIGSDFDGMTQYPADLPHSGEFPALCEALLCAGLRREQVQKIAFDNLCTYISAFL
ncbi:dipeptidase [Christensenellaceae bacterium OttesenSCG-928-L17]|nr:dipeptidase [Christensenellaceae bacterium OttesenSCG-928-L17]